MLLRNAFRPSYIRVERQSMAQAVPDIFLNENHYQQLKKVTT